MPTRAGGRIPIVSRFGAAKTNRQHAKSAKDLSEKMGIDMPITAEVYRVLYEDKDPLAAVTDLMLRRPRGEK